MSIKLKLVVSYLIIILICVSISVLGILNVKKINKLDEEMYTYNTEPLQQLIEISTLYQRIRVNIRDIVLNDNINNISEKVEKSKTFRKDINTSLNLFKKSIISKEVEDYYNNLNIQLTKYYDIENKIINLCLQNKKSEAYQTIKNNYTLTTEIDECIKNIYAVKISQAKIKSENNTAITKSTIITNIILLIIVLITTIGIAFYIITNINKSIKNIINYTEKLSEGNFSEKMSIKSHDEISFIVTGLNKMVESVIEILHEIIDKSAIVSNSSKELRASSNQIANANMDTAQNINEISQSVQNISTTIQSTFDYAKETGNSFNELNSDLKNITNITNLIEEIASQTNLLSLNASIEAARVGETGRGFDVLAREIKSLAIKSAEHSKDIKNLIYNLQNKSSKSVKHINSLVEQTENVSCATQQISSSMETIAASAQEQAASLEQISSLSEHLSALADELRKLTNKFTV